MVYHSIADRPPVLPSSLECYKPERGPNGDQPFGDTQTKFRGVRVLNGCGLFGRYNGCQRRGMTSGRCLSEGQSYACAWQSEADK